MVCKGRLCKDANKVPQAPTAKELLPKNMLGLVNEWICVYFFKGGGERKGDVIDQQSVIEFKSGY